MKKVLWIVLAVVLVALFLDCAVALLRHEHWLGLVGFIGGIALASFIGWLVDDIFRKDVVTTTTGAIVFVAAMLVGSTIYFSTSEGNWVINGRSTAEGWKLALPGIQSIRFVETTKIGGFEADVLGIHSSVAYVLEMEPGTEVRVAAAMRNARDDSPQEELFKEGEAIIRVYAGVEVWKDDSCHGVGCVHLVLRPEYAKELHDIGLHVKSGVSYQVHTVH